MLGISPHELRFHLITSISSHGTYSRFYHGYHRSRQDLGMERNPRVRFSRFFPPSLNLSSEIVGIVVVFLSGCLVGLCFANWGPYLEWPTGEMAGRGTAPGFVHVSLIFYSLIFRLLIGVVIAAPSGVGVALAVSVFPSLVPLSWHFRWQTSILW